MSLHQIQFDLNFKAAGLSLENEYSSIRLTGQIAIFIFLFSLCLHMYSFI